MLIFNILIMVLFVAET